MRHFALATTLLFVPVVAHTDSNKDDLTLLQGKWVVAFIEEDGVKVPTADLGMVLTIRGNRYTWADGERPGSIKLDAKKTPKQADYTITDGDDKGSVELAIYEIKGDTWRDCIGRAGQDRPTEFAAPKNSGYRVMHYRRVK